MVMAYRTAPSWDELASDIVQLIQLSDLDSLNVKAMLLRGLCLVLQESLQKQVSWVSDGLTGNFCGTTTDRKAIGPSKCCPIFFWNLFEGEHLCSRSLESLGSRLRICCTKRGLSKSFVIRQNVGWARWHEMVRTSKNPTFGWVYWYDPYDDNMMNVSYVMMPYGKVRPFERQNFQGFQNGLAA